jgi:hypothetical protein
MYLIRDNSETGKIEIHDAVLNALAKAAYRRSGAHDRSASLELFKSERMRIEAEEGEPAYRRGLSCN